MDRHCRALKLMDLNVACLGTKAPPTVWDSWFWTPHHESDLAPALGCEFVVARLVFSTPCWLAGVLNPALCYFPILGLGRPRNGLRSNQSTAEPSAKMTLTVFLRCAPSRVPTSGPSGHGLRPGRAGHSGGEEGAERSRVSQYFGPTSDEQKPPLSAWSGET